MRKKKQIKKPHNCIIANAISIIKNNGWSYLIDLLFLLVIIAFFVLEHLDVFRLCKDINISLDILIVLLPAVITIISISIQMQSDSICGISVKEFQKLRTGLHFGLVHMLLVSIAIFTVDFVSKLISFNDISFYLIIISIIYSLLFVVLELPILMQNDFSISLVVRGFYKKHYKNLSAFKSKDEYDFFDKVLVYLILNQGIKDTFSLLKVKESAKGDVLDYLLVKQNEFLFNYREEIILRKKNNCLDVDACNSIVNRAYTNLIDLFAIANDFNYLIFDKTGQQTYHLTRTTYVLHDILTTIGADEEIEEKQLFSVIYNYLLNIDGANESVLYNNYLISMSTTSLSSGDVWFVKALRDFDYSPLFYGFDNYLLFYFLTIHMCFIVHSDMVSKETKDKIMSFLNEKSKGINSDGQSFIDKIRRTLDNLNNHEELITGLDKILNLYASINSVVCDVHPKMMAVYTYDDNVHFSEGLIIDYWIDLIVYHPYFYMSSDDCFELLSKMGSDNQRLVASTLGHRWFDNDKLKENKQPLFLTFLYGDREKANPNEAVINGLIRFRDKYNKDKHEKEYKPLTDETLIGIKEEVDDSVIKSIKDLRLPGHVDTKGEKELYYWLRIEGNDIEHLLKMYLSRLKDSMQELIKKMIGESIKRKSFGDYKYNQKDVDAIISFKPDFSSENHRLSYSCNPEQLEEVKKLTIIKVSYLPSDTYSKVNAVEATIEYVKDLTVPRFATREEIEKIIDKEYTMSNGLYRFSDYKGDYANSFLVTRDELKQLLIRRIVFLPIVIRVAIRINNQKGVISFKHKLDNDD